MIYDNEDTENYRFEVHNDELIGYGYGFSISRSHFNPTTKKYEWEIPHQVIATKKNPIVWLTTNNTDERVLREQLPKLKGAKKIREITNPNWDEDPYGRRVQRGSIVKQVWNLSGCFDNCKPQMPSDVELYEFEHCL